MYNIMSDSYIGMTLTPQPLIKLEAHTVITKSMNLSAMNFRKKSNSSNTSIT